jgi:hypothetical protein
MTTQPASNSFPLRFLNKRSPEDLAGYVFISWILILLAVDLLTLRWFPVPWNDEVMFADPAASLVFQGHWASSAWYGRGDLTYWTGNVPGYSFLLVPWMWLWGVSAPAVRSLNCVLIAITFICAWFSVKRLNLIPSPKIRLATLAALSLCYPVSFCVRVGRPDVLGMLIFSVGAFWWASSKKAVALTGLFCCAMLIPFTGLHYVFFMPVLLGVLLLASGNASLLRIFTTIGGGIFGGLLLVAYHQFFAGWDGLLASMTDVHSRQPAGLWTNFQTLIKEQLLHYYLQRPHFIFLILLTALLGMAWKHLIGSSRRVWLQALTMLVFPALLVGLGSQFRAPYHWLAVVPAMILLASAAAKSWENLGAKTKLAGGLLVLGLALSGRLIFIGLGGFLGDASYTSQINKAAAAWVSPGEIIYGDWQVYYAVKPLAGRIYYEHLVPKLAPQEKASISTAFIHPQGQYEAHDAQWLVDTFGGRWTHVADLPDPRAKINPLVAKVLDRFNPECFIGTQLSVYRREKDPSNPETLPISQPPDPKQK